MVSHLDTIVETLNQQENQAALPPVENWNPDYSGEIDIYIDREGHWFHEGDAFQRESLVKLFASILKKEGEEYFLVSPVEKFKLKVADLPFVVTEVVQAQHEGQVVLVFKTNLGDQVIVDEDHPIEVEYKDDSEEPLPSVKVRRNLFARIHRNVFYELVEMGEEKQVDGRTCLVVTSGGYEFILGEF